MDLAELARRAAALRALHDRRNPLLLPNAWDAASARAVAEAGFPAVATTSGGVAASLGWPDGERLPPEEMFAAVGRIAGAVEVPVTADVEAGYGLAPAELVDRLLAAGAVGCNLEDTDHAAGGLVDVDRQAERLAAVKAAARAAGGDLVVNARVDVFIRQHGAAEDRVDLALARAERYAEAGADCVYPIGADAAALARFAARFPGAVNGMVRPGVAPLSRLRHVGLARISLASSLQRLAMDDLRRRLVLVAAGDDGWSA